jgi:nucleoside-diphosphate-sugar epimerase
MNATRRLKDSDRVLITGGTGFIGKHLAARCLRDTPHVYCISFSGAYAGVPDGKSGHLVRADLKDKTGLSAVLGENGFDYVFNLGGYIYHTPYLGGGREVMDAHFTGLMNLIDCIDTRELKGFVQMGSSDEYGGSLAPQREDMREKPISPYSAAKTAATYFIQMLARTENFPGVVLRPFLVYGPGQDSRRFLPQIIKACLRDEEFKTSAGIQLRDFCYVGDVAEAMLVAATTPAARGTVINIGSGVPVTIRETVEKLVSMIGGGKPQWGTIPYREGESMELYPDISLATKLMGWKPATDFDTGLRETIQYYSSFPD